MVTYRLRLSGLLVQSQPPHPLLFFLFFFFLLSPSVFASDYSVKDDVDILEMTLPEFAQDEMSPFSLNTTMPTGYFYLPSRYDNVSWRWNQKQSMVTSASDFSSAMWARLDDGDKTLMGSIANIVSGLEADIKANSVSLPVLDSWVNTFTAPDLSNSVKHTAITVPNLLAVLARNQYSTYDFLNRRFTVKNVGVIGGSTVASTSLGSSVAQITRNQKAFYDNLGFNRDHAAWSILDGDVNSLGTGNSFSDLLAIGTSNQAGLLRSLKSWLTNDNLNEYRLSLDGISKTTPNDTSLFSLNRDGFLGLANLIAGSYDKKGSKPGIGVFWTDPNNPLLPSERPEVYNNLFDFFSIWAGNLDRSLVKLQYVLANDEDIEFEEQEKPNQDQVKDDFFGDGDGAVQPGDISAAGDLAGSMKDSFAGAGSATDAFVAINSSDAYSFFSQEVSNSLDTVGNPAAISNDDFMDNFVANEDGFYSLFDTSFFDMTSFLQGEKK